MVRVDLFLGGQRPRRGATPDLADRRERRRHHPGLQPVDRRDPKPAGRAGWVGGLLRRSFNAIGNLTRVSSD